MKTNHLNLFTATLILGVMFCTPLISALPEPIIQNTSQLTITKYDGVEAETYLADTQGSELCLYHKAGTDAQTLQELKQLIQDAQEQVPDWAVNISYKISDLVKYSNQIYKVLQAHTSQANWFPPNVPALFTPYSFQSLGEVPQWVQPTGGYDAYNIGDRIWFQVGENKLIYESLINANVWSPIAYPSGWKEVGKISESEIYGNETITALDGLGNSLVVPRELDEGVSIYCVEVEDKIQIGSNTIIAEWLNSTLYVYPTDTLDIDPFIIEVYFDGVKQEYPNLAWVSEQPIEEGVKFNANITNFVPRNNVTFRQNKLQVNDCEIGFFGSACQNYYVDYSEFERLNNITDKVVTEGLMEQSVWEEFTDWFLGIFGKEPDLSDRTYYDITYYGYITDLDPTITKTYNYSSQAILNDTQANPNALYLEVNSTGQKYASFDGTGDYIDTNWKLPDLGATNTGNLTWSQWVKLVEVNDWQYIGGVIGSDGKTGMYWLITNTNYPIFYMRDEDSSGACYVSNATRFINDSAWHNLVAIRGYGSGADAYRLYIDGVYQDNEWYQTNCDGAIPLTTKGVDLWFGGLNTNNSIGTSNYGGYLDEVIIMNKSINETVISSLYSNGRTNRYTGADASSIIGYWDFSQGNFKAENIISGEKATFNGDAKLIPEDDTTNPYNNLIGYWSFDADDTTAYDLSGNGWHGAYTAGAYMNTTCDSGYGNCAFFVGDGDYIATTKKAPEGVVTTCSWVKPNDATKNRYYMIYDNKLFSSATTPNGTALALQYIDVTGWWLHLHVGNGSVEERESIRTYIDFLNTWRHVCVSSNGSLVTYYVDGESIGTDALTTATGSLPESQYNMMIGKRISGTAYPMYGHIDEFMYFNTILNSTQIEAIYNNQSQRFKNNGTAILSNVALNETGNDLVNWTINKTNLLGSKVYGKIGYCENTTYICGNTTANYTFTDEQEFTGSTLQFQVYSNTTNLLPYLRLESPNFYTPYVFNSQIFTISQSPPPSIQFVSPTTETGSYESTTILSNITYSGTGITEVKTYLYNTTNKVNETTTNYTEFINLPFETYTLFACATNPTGTNCTENRTITLQADATPPKYSAITNPTDGGYSDNPYCFQIDWTDSHFSEAFVVVEGTYYEMANSGGDTYEECLNLSAGTFNYSYFANDTYTNGNQTGNYELIISKATPSLSLTSTAGWTIVPDSSTTITGTSTLTGNQLFLDDSLVANPYTTFFSEGNYTFKVNLSESQNYSSGSLSKVLTVANASVSTGTMCLQTGFGYNYLNNRKYISC